MNLKNYYMIYSGYRDNYSIYKSYKDEEIITLYQLENSWLGSTQSFEESSMDIWIKEDYDIPQDVQFEWMDIYEIEYEK